MSLPTMNLRIALVEDDPLYGSSFALVLRDTSVALADLFESAEEALEALASGTRWDVLVMDFHLPGIAGDEATRKVRAIAPEQPVVVLTAFDDPPRLISAIQAGADGYLLKNIDGSELVNSLMHAANGGAPLTPLVARHVLDLLRGPSNKEAESADTLSPREKDVLEGLVAGQSYKQIADQLGLSLETVRGYIRTLYRKLRVHSATEAVHTAHRRGWIFGGRLVNRFFR